MPAQTTLAAGVMAVLSVSALLAQSQDQPLHYCYGGGPNCTPRQSTPPATETKLPQTQQPEEIRIPFVLHFCAAHCLTFNLEPDGTLVNYTNLPAQTNMKRVLRIQEFTPDSVVIHRTDTGNYPGDGMMRGRMLYGNRRAKGDGWEISWGEALDVLPADDEARAMREGTLPPTGMSLSDENLEMLRLFFGMFAGSGSGSGSGSGDSSARYKGLKEGCANGFSSACGQIGQKPPKD
jgi:hypothetical protein